MLAFAVCSNAGLLPAAVDLSHGAWGAGHWGASPWAAAPWGAGHWGAAAAPYWGHSWGGPSLTTSHSWGSWAAPAYAYGPTTAHHADPSPHGHDGCV